MRQLHKFLGLAAGLLVMLLSLTGALLAVYPVIDTLATTSIPADLTVSEFLGSPGLDGVQVLNLDVTPSGSVQAMTIANDAYIKMALSASDPAVHSAITPSATKAFVTELHRSLFLGDQGRLITTGAAAIMFALSLSGLVMLVRRQGGISGLIAPIQGKGLGWVHSYFARLAGLILILTTLTGLYLSALYFELIPDRSRFEPAYPMDVQTGTPLPAADIPMLSDTPLTTLVRLAIPDSTDIYGLYDIETTQGWGYIEASTGTVLAWADKPMIIQINDWMMKLHTGQGVWMLAIVLGIGSAIATVLGPLGWMISFQNRNLRLNQSQNSSAKNAEIVIFVGSENGSTNGFANALHRGLVKAGFACHLTGMDKVGDDYPNAHSILCLASTYGDGAAPQNATGFVDKVTQVRFAPNARFSILGFGEKSFPKFCAFAHLLHDTIAAAGKEMLLPLHTVNAKSAQDFDAYCRAVSNVLKVPLDIKYKPKTTKTEALTLIEKRVYGRANQAETAILRFAFAHPSWWGRLTRPAYEAGDLIAVIAPHTTSPRYYSLASSSRDGFVEICVRRVAGGKCSGYLVDLQPGDEIQVSLVKNTNFHAPKTSLILVGAGTGIGPLAGIIRNNRAGQDITLYQGIRDASSDALFAEEISQWMNDGQLQKHNLAQSRVAPVSYVQHKIAQDSHAIAAKISQGATIMVCGGVDMASAVRDALKSICTDHGLDFDRLCVERGYIEDVF